jgi:hypothetical protein
MPQSVGLPLFDAINDAILGVFGETNPITLIKYDIDGGTIAIVETEGVFDARHFSVEVNGEVPISEYQTILLCRRSAVDPFSHDDRITVRGTDYLIKDSRPDSEGMVVLVLALAPA